MIKTDHPFLFYSRLNLIELTGLKAATIKELVEHLRNIPGTCIYHHTHNFVQQHQYLSPEPPNDFAYWASDVLGDRELGEKLASIDIMSHSSIHSIRQALMEVFEKALESKPRLSHLSAPEGREFFFLKSVSFIFPTPHQAFDLKDFSDCLRKVSLDSIYFHIFEARLRLEKPTNDFSLWLTDALKEKELSDQISKLDPYSLTTDRLRAEILRLTDRRLKLQGG